MAHVLTLYSCIVFQDFERTGRDELCRARLGRGGAHQDEHQLQNKPRRRLREEQRAHGDPERRQRLRHGRCVRETVTTLL